jgi:hypothetical protein
MKISIFTYCDFASFYGGKLCIMGATDQIGVPNLPAAKSGFIVARIHFERGDEGSHTFTSAITDADGKPIVKAESKPMTVTKFQDDPQKNEMKFHCKFDLVRFKIPKYGEYTLELRDNGSVCASVPMMVFLLKPNQPH